MRKRAKTDRVQTRLYRIRGWGLVQVQAEERYVKNPRPLMRAGISGV